MGYQASIVFVTKNDLIFKNVDTEMYLLFSKNSNCFSAEAGSVTDKSTNILDVPYQQTMNM